MVLGIKSSRITDGVSKNDGTKPRTEPLAERPRNNIDPAARRKSSDDADRLGRILWGSRRGGNDAAGCGQQCEADYGREFAHEGWSSVRRAVGDVDDCIPAWMQRTAASPAFRLTSLGGSPGAGHFSCAAKQSNPKKAPKEPRLRGPCVTRPAGRLRNSLSS